MRKEELEATLSGKTKVPTEKYLQPVTTAQEIGWMHLEYAGVSVCVCLFMHACMYVRLCVCVCICMYV